ncbi:MAG: multidrug efflux SMR transporter [Rhodomicrobium sp.]
MAWTYLFLAGICEVGWAIGLKYSNGLSRPVAAAFTIVLMLVSAGLLGLALRTLPVGTAYAVWTGIGTVGTAVLGLYLFSEPATAVRLLGIGLVLAGVVTLKIIG